MSQSQIDMQSVDTDPAMKKMVSDLVDGAGPKRDGAVKGGVAVEGDGAGYRKGGAGPKRDGTGYRKGGAGPKRDGAGYRKDGAGPKQKGAGHRTNGSQNTLGGHLRAKGIGGDSSVLLVAY